MHENLLKQSNYFEDVALNMDTNKTQNLEILLGAAGFLPKKKKNRKYSRHAYCSWSPHTRSFWDTQ